MGFKLYRVIADGVINRDLAMTRKDWEGMKAEAEEDMAFLVKDADTETENRLARDARENVTPSISTFEKVIPLEDDKVLRGF